MDTSISTSMYLVLLVLQHKDTHGYDIVKEVAQLTENEENLSLTSMYRAVNSLLHMNCIEQIDVESDDIRRRYYHITQKGYNVIQTHKAYLRRFLNYGGE